MFTLVIAAHLAEIAAYFITIAVSVAVVIADCSLEDIAEENGNDLS